MLVLASSSPRRKQLLGLLGHTFQIEPARIDERCRAGEHPESYVRRMAQEKADFVAVDRLDAGVVLAADTVVVDGDQILGKPSNRQEAVAMLKQLRGKNHQVITGLTAVRVPEGKQVSNLCVSQVTMRDYSEDEIEAYVDSGDPLDKAGAYAIQHPGFHPVDHLEGCYTNVVGLPLCQVAKILSEMDVEVLSTLPYPCLYSQPGLAKVPAVCSFLLDGL